VHAFMHYIDHALHKCADIIHLEPRTAVYVEATK
jgi:hypothetical protein